MTGYKTNRDKMLNAVLLSDTLMKTGGYSEKDFATFDQALVSQNPIVRTVARIIQGHSDGNTSKNIYNEITDYLKNFV